MCTSAFTLNISQQALHCHLRLSISPVVHGFNRETGFGDNLALAYQILAKSNNPRLIYCHLTLSIWPPSAILNLIRSEF